MSKAPLKKGSNAVRPIGLMDALRFAAPGGADRQNRAFTLFSLCGGQPISPSLAHLIGECAPFSRGSRTWVQAQGLRISGLASFRQRSGVSSWEIDLLSLELSGHGLFPYLLDAICHSVAARGGERIFLRVAWDDPVIEGARLGGFYPALHEVLYVGRAEPKRHQGRTPVGAGEVALRAKTPADDYNLFRLHNASTPSDVRAGTGMTFQQWKANEEPLPGRHRELVVDEGGVQGWLRTGRIGRSGVLAAVVQPGREDLLPVMIQQARRTLRGADRIRSLVPRHQDALRRVLVDAGFRRAAEFVTMARSLKVPIESKVRAGATTAFG